MGEQPLGGGVLTLKILEPFGVRGLQSAELVALPTMRRFGDTQLAARRGGVFALANRNDFCVLPARGLVVIGPGVLLGGTSE